MISASGAICVMGVVHSRLPFVRPRLVSLLKSSSDLNAMLRKSTQILQQLCSLLLCLSSSACAKWSKIECIFMRENWQHLEALLSKFPVTGYMLPPICTTHVWFFFLSAVRSTNKPEASAGRKCDWPTATHLRPFPRCRSLHARRS